MNSRVLELWGKADPTRAGVDESEWHPLLCHIVDVTECARTLLTDVFPRRLDALARTLGLAPDVALRWILFSIALHDLGKATPPFQAKVEHRRAVLEAMGLDFPDANEPHGTMSALLVPAALERYGVPARLARSLARAVGAHHGDFATQNHLLDVDDDVDRQAGRRPLWQELRAELIGALAELIGIQGSVAPRFPKTPSERNALMADLAGLTTVADWVGSNADVFRYVTPPASLEAYSLVARRRAEASLGETGFRAPPRPTPRSFFDLFQKAPWPLHETVAQLLPTLRPGALVIVEAPMGEGKTEAALLLYDTLAAGGAEGLFFALPTQATSNQILGRVERYLASCFPDETHGLHLVHGGAGLSDRYGRLKERAFHVRSVDGISRRTLDTGPQADAWFATSKRALLAPLGVGTVDQALLSVLRSKWHFLRLHGLARKVFVVDEVHAYDTFTGDILARLVAWLKALGGTVVLLSATLASQQKAQLLKAYGCGESAPTAPYPRVTVATPTGLTVQAFSARRPPVSLALEWKGETAVLGDIGNAIRSGGSIAVIVNTVARAQAIFLELTAMKAGGKLAQDLCLSLLHARFPLAERLRREAAVERAFGPPGASTERPRAAILVGTQVLEQSLDLDFDLMVTDLAPVDLLLQRSGRLHRHDRAERPRGLESRQLWVIEPEGADAVNGPAFEPSSYVYDEAILLRSFLVLRDRTKVAIPTDIEALVEAVYAPEAPSGVSSEIRKRLDELDAQRRNQNRGDLQNAATRELPSPEEHDPFASFTVHFQDDEDPTVNEQLRAITRLGETNVSVIPVYAAGSHWVVANAPTVSFDPAVKELSFRDVVAIAKQTLGISRKNVVFALLKDPAPKAFQRSGHLRHHRLLILNEAGEADIAGTHLRLDPALGLIVGELAAAALPS